MGVALPGGQVRVRCDRCARDLGRDAPTLVVCVRETGHWAVGLHDRWELIGLGTRRPSRPANAPAPLPNPPVPGVSGVTTLGGRTIDQNMLRPARGYQLTCRRCDRRPRVTRRDLYELAERALAVGLRDAYV